MDILIPLKPSTYFDLEIQFTLRSIDKNLKGINRVFLVGHLPKFVHGVEYVKCPDMGKTAHHRILHKILHTIKTTDISDDFLFMNDDHFLTRPANAKTYPNYYDMSLADAVTVKRKSSLYQEFVINTYKIIPDGLHYDIHCPMVFNRTAFQQAMNSVDWSKKSYLIKSLYANFVGVKPSQMTDCKLNLNDDYERRIENRLFFSSSNEMHYPRFKKLLQNLYPEPSKYEKVEVSLNK